MITDETELCTVQEAASQLHVSVPTVWRWVKSGALPAYRVGVRAIRIRRSDLATVVRPVKPATQKDANLEPYTIHTGNPDISTDELMERLRAVRERIFARRGGKPLPPSAPLIRKAREERHRQL